MGRLSESKTIQKLFWKQNKLAPDIKKANAPPGFTAMRNPEALAGNRPKNRKYPSKARTPLGG